MRFLDIVRRDHGEIMNQLPQQIVPAGGGGGQNERNRQSHVAMSGAPGPSVNGISKNGQTKSVCTRSKSG
jgi:hypothetical protein